MPYVSLSYRKTLTSKSLINRRKNFENKIKQLVSNSLANNNKELTERNVTLLAEIQELRNEKLELLEKFMFRQNTNQTVIKNDLTLLLETIRSEHKNIVEKFETTQNLYNQMINKISDKIEELVESEENSETTLNNVGSGSPEVPSDAIPGPSKSSQIYETKRISRQNCSPDYANIGSLSVIQETSREISLRNDNISVECHSFQTPNNKTRNSVAEYQMAYDFSDQNFQTPSIYNFQSISRKTMNEDLTIRTPMPLLDLSERPDISFQSYESFESTITEANNNNNNNLMTSSTPIIQNRLSDLETIRRPSSRLSSINPYFSPRQLQRPSLIDIQNVTENKAKRKKVRPKKQTAKRTKTETNDSIECQTTEPNLNTTKKSPKKLNTISIDSDVSAVSSNGSHSLRSSRRIKKPIERLNYDR